MTTHQRPYGEVDTPGIAPSEYLLQGGMDSPAKRLKEIMEFIRDVASVCYDGNGGLGDYVPAVRELGQRADELRSGWLDTFNLESPPNEDAIIGFSQETTDCLDAMREISTRLARLLLRDFGEEPAV